MEDGEGSRWFTLIGIWELHVIPQAGTVNLFRLDQDQMTIELQEAIVSAFLKIICFDRYAFVNNNNGWDFKFWVQL